MHKLDDDRLVTADLLRKFIAFAQEDTSDERHFALLQRADRSWLTHAPGSPDLNPVLMAYTQQLLTLLNDELHHDGAWVALWSGPGQREHMTQIDGAYCCLNLCWMDHDGDVKFRLDWIAGENEDWITLPALLMAGVIPMAEQAETAWQQANALHVATLDLKLNQSDSSTHKKALGEAAPSVH
jgi:hypothetical protein